MALLHWRKFPFFDEDYIANTELNQLVTQEEPKDIPKNEQQQKISFITVKLTTSSSGRGNILLGDANGYVYIINKQLKINSFKANQKKTLLVKQVPKSPIFITCGSDQPGTNPLIKLWDPEKTDRLNQPTCIRVIRANSGFIHPAEVTCIECNEILTLMVVGYDDGSIVLFHGDVTRPRKSKFGRPIKISDRQITGFVIRGNIKIDRQSDPTSGYLNSGQPQVETTAFISTEDEIFFATFSDKSFSKVQLDQSGCSLKCCCLLPTNESKGSNDNLFAVGRSNAVYFYQIDGRGPCLAFEGEKILLYRFKNYLVILGRETTTKSEANPLRSRRAQTTDNIGPDYRKRLNLNIYDIKNKYIAHTSSIPEIQELFSEWGNLFVVTTSGQVIVFREKDTHTKLETLFRKNQFSLVIDIAKSHQYSEEALTEIFKHYGDHLYRKGDYNGAISQYMKTIGSSEPSYVIQKFLDSRRISYLTVYLEALHQKSHASQEHTVLLLNCYSKLRNDQQLKQFIESYEEGNIKFDVEIAINVLREAGFHEFAIDLAKKHQKHELFFRIQMDDENNCDAALEYMDGMVDSNEMATYMKKYGRVMLRDAPEKTLSMIKTICQRSRDFTTRPSDTSPFQSMPYYRKIYPEEFFHIFVDTNNLFVQLLEQLVSDGTEFATKAVHNLLLELYLNTWRKEKDDLMKSLIADKVKRLLSQPGEKFDLDQALILCRNSRFDEGLIDLYARAGLYHLVLEHHITQNDSLQIMKTCELYGDQDPNLYMPALIHFSKIGDERLCQLLKAIEHQKVISPMVVIEKLLESKRINLGSVKDYLVRYLGRLQDMVLDNENAIDHDKGDTEIVRQKIEEFESHQVVFKPSRCAACPSVLEPPSVHFLCNHSYHQSCFHNFAARDDECPICEETNEKLIEEIGSHENSKSKLHEIEKQFSAPSDDMFNSLAKLFGYGLFN